MPSLRWCAVLALVAAAGCGGPHAQATPDAAPHLGLEDPCTAQPPAGWTNADSLTFTSTPATGAQLVAMLSPLYTASFQLDGATAPPASQLTMGLTYTGGAITCGALECSCDPPGPCDASRCQGPTLRVEMNETFMTADGELDEQVDGQILSEDTTSVGFEAEVPATQLHGSYQPTIDAPQHVTISFSGELAGGRITDGVVNQSSPTATAGVGVIQ